MLLVSRPPATLEVRLDLEMMKGRSMRALDVEDVVSANESDWMWKNGSLCGHVSVMHDS